MTELIGYSTQNKTRDKPTQDNSAPPLILAIDTSCDETAAAVTWGRVVLSNVIASQAEIHRPYGGVYPTLAKRAHQQNIRPTINTALDRARIEPKQLQAIAVTIGPGLAPALEIGLKTAKDLSQAWDKPVIACNHLEGHALSILAHRRSRSFAQLQERQLKINHPDFPAWQTAAINQRYFPLLALVVSGGHSQFVLVKKIGDYQVLGQTIDDAAGEALDKVGRMLNLGYPAGPVMEELAKKGAADRFQFPLPMTTRPDFNLSYSGLKTSAHHLITDLRSKKQLDAQATADVAASFQYAVFRHLTYKLDKLLAAAQKETRLPQNQQAAESKEQVAGPGKLGQSEVKETNENTKEGREIKTQLAPLLQADQVWLGGGVAANIQLRRQLRTTLRPYKLRLKTPYEKRLCGDNAVMIGLAANFLWQRGSVWQKEQLKKLERQPSLQCSQRLQP
jgi:N6-L-threonylcarbamoyladenine synthase